MIQKVWNWIIIFFAAIYLPVSSYASVIADSANTQVVLNCPGIIEFLGIFSNPEYYLNTTEYIDEEHLADIQETAELLTDKCYNTYDKIYAVFAYVSDNIYYDYQYFEGLEFRSQDSYTVFMSNIAVCQGYSDLATVMLRSIGISCMTATSTTHAYNFAHDGERWIFFDPTWCSLNKYNTNGTFSYNGYIDNYFDLSSSEIESLGISHETSYIICGTAVAEFDWDTQSAAISSAKQKSALLVPANIF